MQSKANFHRGRRDPFLIRPRYDNCKHLRSRAIGSWPALRTNSEFLAGGIPDTSAPHVECILCLPRIHLTWEASSLLTCAGWGQ
eukprot:2073826-Alexandrium_andersonii.AAC.1